MRAITLAVTQACFSGGSSKALAIHREHRIYVSDRDNDRIQVSSEDGQFIDEWPDIEGPTGIYIDQNEQVRVMSTTLNQISQYRKWRACSSTSLAPAAPLMVASAAVSRSRTR